MNSRPTRCCEPEASSEIVSAVINSGNYNAALSIASNWLQTNTKGEYIYDQIGNTLYEFQIDPKTGQRINQKAVITNTGSTSTTQDQENTAAVNLYSTTVQEEINNGASPQQAVQVAVGVAAATGTKLGLLEQNALLQIANQYAQTKQTTATTGTSLTPPPPQREQTAWEKIGNIINPLSNFIFGE